jgi:hypothetical protein
MQLLRGQRVDVTEPTTAQLHPPAPPVVLSRAQRAHYRLSWNQRLARNARAQTAARPLITLFGIPAVFAVCLGLPTA